MVGKHANIIVSSPPRGSDCIRVVACDPRSDDRRRYVDVARETVTIRRAVAGVSMAIRVKACAYRGVALRIIRLADGRFHYEVRLAHRDPDLSVQLGEGEDLAAIEAQWREWVAFLRLPALAGRTEALDAPVSIGGVELARRAPHPRRRGSALTSRRPRFLRRREPGRKLNPGVADDDPIVLFYGWKADS